MGVDARDQLPRTLRVDHLAIDAMLDPDPVPHEHSIVRVFPCLGETGTTRQILELLPSVDQVWRWSSCGRRGFERAQGTISPSTPRMKISIETSSWRSS